MYLGTVDIFSTECDHTILKKSYIAIRKLVKPDQVISEVKMFYQIMLLYMYEGCSK